jgi:hypothetical protein
MATIVTVLYLTGRLLVYKLNITWKKINNITQKFILDSVLIEYDSMSLGNLFPTFWRCFFEILETIYPLM